MVRIRKGWQYVIEEWDGTREWVEVVKRTAEFVWMKYLHGKEEVHKVPKEYFKKHVWHVGGLNGLKDMRSFMEAFASDT